MELGRHGGEAMLLGPVAAGSFRDPREEAGYLPWIHAAAEMEDWLPMDK